MRYIKKSGEPAALIIWKNKKNNDWQPEYEILQNPEKQALHESLIQEQTYHCCYCERLITARDSHIEHFLPQEKYEHLELEYSNLLCSCGRSRSRNTPSHCGDAKGNQEILLNPTSPDINGKIGFLFDGYVCSQNIQDVTIAEGIEILKLNCPALRELRKKALSGFLEAITDFDKESLSKFDPEKFSFPSLIETLLRQDCTGTM